MSSKYDLNSTFEDVSLCFMQNTLQRGKACGFPKQGNIVSPECT